MNSQPHAGPHRRGTTSTSGARYRERLWVPWWWWPAALAVLELLAAEVHHGAAGVRSWLPYVLAAPVAVGVLLSVGRTPVAVDAGRGLRVGRAYLPAAEIGRVDIYRAEHKRAALGRELDSDAFLTHRGWIGPLLRVQVLDQRDPVPYWLISTRHPDRLAAALAQRDGSGQRDGSERSS